MPKTDISVRELVDMIDRGELRLPELQRRYVWPATRVRDLLDSLYRGYPSGAILVWETTEGTPSRDLAIEQRVNAFGSHKLLLDGQQRLTSLSAVLRGEPLKFRNRVRPVEIAFNLDHPEGPPTEVTEVEDDEVAIDRVADEDLDFGGDGRSVQERVRNRTFVVASRALLAEPHWVRVSDIFNPKVREWDLLKRLVDSPDDPDYERYSRRIQRVKKIGDYQYVMHLLERDLSYEEVAEIFVRVNSLGMKLRGSDLAMAQITARWPGALDKFEEFAEECEKVSFTFDLGLLVRTLVVFATGQSRFRTVAGISVPMMKESWEKAKGGLRFAINFLRANAGIEDESLLSSPLLVIPLAVLAVNNEFQFSDDDQRQLLHWLFFANATGHYSRGSSETILDADLTTILRRDGGAPELLDLVKQQFGRIRFTAADFAGRSARNPLFQTTYLAAKHAGAKDWRSGLVISLAHSGKSHSIQTHHIFPKAITKDYDVINVNEIANLAFVSGGHNRSISSKAPSAYLPEIVRTRGPEALTAQGVPIDTALWQLENFQAFLEYRRAELAQMVNDFLNEVVREGGRHSDIPGLVSEGEGPTVEFKQTARFNLRTGAQDKTLEGVVAKTVAGFMNASGGTLVIGVDDDGNPVGLDRDLGTLAKPNLDGYQLFLRNLLNAAVGADLCVRIGIEFPAMEGIQVCALRVPAAARAVWVSSGNDKIFYVRSGNSTQPLNSEQAHCYITSHWRG
jgi:hypothetical protein